MRVTSTTAFRRLLAMCLFIAMWWAPSAFAQLSEGGIPYSFNHKVGVMVPEFRMPEVNTQVLLTEDEQDLTKGVPLRFGYKHGVTYSTQNSGIWENLPDGGKLWRLHIVCPGAITTNLLFSEYLVPSGAKLYLYNDAKTEVLGAFTSRNNKEDGKFATSLLRGEAVTLEYYVPANSASDGVIALSDIVHGYRDVFKLRRFGEDFGTSGTCNININCPQGAPWQNEKRAVALIIADGSRLCTGAMINNVRQDLTPYFLTANHCISGETPATWVFVFKYESPDCSITDGPLNYSLSGSAIKANNASSDFALLKLNEAPPDSYKVHFMGWNANEVAASTGAGIHHPDGDIKKISFVSVPFESDTYSGTPANSHWRTRWSAGVTEPGSSGSPIFDQDHHVVGQLHGGPSACDATDKSDLYGKFSWSWNYGTTSTTRLKDWLDPDNTGTMVLNGWDPSMGTRDSIPPTRVTDIHTIAKLSNAITIGWSAPMDTSYGGVMKYDLRYSTNAITDTNNFALATPVATTKPKPAGSAETISIAGLTPKTKYYFALRSSDSWGNVSLLSNILSDSTLTNPVLSVTPESITRQVQPQGVVVDSVVISNISTAQSTLDYTVDLANNTFPGKVQMSIVPFATPGSDKLLQEKNSREETLFGQSIKGSGGPDSAGYKWIDSDDPNGPQYVWNDISTTGTELTTWVATGTFNAKDEGYSGPITLGFPFKFYKQDKTQVYVGSNGLILFNQPTANYVTNATIPTAAVPNDYIAPFWDDLDGSSSGHVYYKQDADKLTIQYQDWPKWLSTGSAMTFQIVLYSSGKIMFYYKSLTGATNSCTVGIENSTGTTGLQIAYNATYLKNSFAVKMSSEPDWLSAQNLSGTLYQNNKASVKLTFRAEDFPVGNYSMDLRVHSNDPNNPLKVVPIKMNLSTVQLPVTVLSPNGGESWVVGTHHPITWAVNGVTNVHIKYSVNNGTDWLPVASNVQASLGTYDWVVPNTLSQQCKVKIINAADSTVSDVSDGAFTISFGQNYWAAGLNVKDNGQLNKNLTLGMAAIATNGIDPVLGEETIPPAPPAGNFDARFELPVTPVEFSLKDFRPDTAQAVTWNINFQPGAQGYPMTFTWDPASLPAGNFMLKDRVTGQLVSVDMKAQGSYTLTNNTVTGLKIEMSKQLTASFPVTSNWNMVSVPLAASNMAANSIFAGANSEVFGYVNGYVTQATLSNGKGYWVRYANPATITVNGNPVATNKIPVVAGWNMVGVYNYKVPVSVITSVPGGILNSYFFSFANGYNQADTLKPGMGCWVRATQAGDIILTAPVEKQVASQPVIQKDNGKIIITDAAGNSSVLYSVSTASFNNDLPPVPPTGIFDARFGTNRNAENLEKSAQIVSIQSALYPVTITAKGMDLQVNDAATNGRMVNHIVKNGEQYIIADKNVTALSVNSITKPLTFELQQNYPNPFNPTTNINFGLPQKAHVTLTIYNQLGQQVAKLVNEEREAGYYSVTWNATGFSSGVYIYELRTNGFISTKKLVLMK
ncbi:MAG: T9SS type A sorting domain-containing protein [Ignavibacteria bacterium]|nr:T9SS type A sorting domain-containing protein [Ignavibacteria bacterium]